MSDEPIDEVPPGDAIDDDDAYDADDEQPDAEE